MKVTKTCDVYSFGVLALEIINGKYLGDVIWRLSSRSAEIEVDHKLSPPTHETEEKLLTYEPTIQAGYAVCLSSLIKLPLQGNSYPDLVHHV